MCWDFFKNLFSKKEEPLSDIIDIIDSYWEKNHPTPSWIVIKIYPDGLLVTYQERYGPLIKVECVGLWENATQYMLTWKDSKEIVLQKDNIVSIDAQSK